MPAECKLTPELQEIILRYLEEGNSYETAAQATGICRKTLYNWITEGEKGNPDFTQFTQAIKKARSKAEMKFVAVINKAMDKNWTAAAWMLERMNPETYGNKSQQKIEHSGKITFEQLRELLKNGDAGNNPDAYTKSLQLSGTNNTKSEQGTDNQQKPSDRD